MRTARLALAALALLAVSCSGGGGSGRAASAVLSGANGDVTVAVEVVDSREERGRGLMHRKSLPENAGMLFLFREEREGGLWMKDTLIPLSVAFFDERGRIVRILDMDPCRAADCPIYRPGISYTGALEVNQGAFERWGVEEGDEIRLEGIGS